MPREDSLTPRILVADDEPSIRELFREILAGDPEDGPDRRFDDLERRLFGAEGQGREDSRPCELTLVSQAVDAVAAVESAVSEGRPYAMVFLDVRMPPGPDGIWAAERIRAADPGVQIVVVTAFSELDAQDIARRVPPADRLLYLRKPFHPQEILQFARSLGAKWRAEREQSAFNERLKAMVEERTQDLALANRRLQEEMVQRDHTASLILVAKREWEATFDSVQDAIVHLDDAFRIRRINMAAARISRKHPRDLVGVPMESLFGTEGGQAVRDMLPQAVETGQAAEVSLPALGGVFLVTAARVPEDAAGQPLTVLVAHDITDHKRMETQLRHSQKMEALGTLAGGIAHDFNNILGIIMGFSELMAAQAEPGGSQQRRLGQILDACRRARDLVAQIMAFGKGGDSLMRPLALTPLVEELMKLIRASTPASIAIDVKRRARRDVILGERTQVEQVLVNLCGNASHAMGHGHGRLEICLDDMDLDQTESSRLGCPGPGPYLRLRVQDNGHGIPAGQLERIFDPFFTTKKPGEGTGMGLAVVHGVVRRHGGCISVSSEPGLGSVFDVYFPLVAESPALDAAPAPKAPSGRKGRALVVDDEPALVEIGVEMLRGLGWSAEGLEAPNAALARIEADPSCCDLLVTDLAMPGMSGLELARAATALRPGLAAVLVSGYGDSASPEELARAGVRAVINKPVSPGQLERVLEEVLGAPEEPRVRPEE
ncbi:Blue-light-activated protein [Fundidesulfovibrio magnetotacticus]|uniref:histidine kinase n=1 Tax=Fundidesulfovibrio magnetotacticus TaxID=2730080 RepID=A0A6V8LV28_9BACT|nr:response regulator [Fundidesulfovibrio magnetotacticus]GFK93676.1 Blue-light-activated protein [Fundidesulfovibrio magnetotacticus]